MEETVKKDEVLEEREHDTPAATAEAGEAAKETETARDGTDEKPRETMVEKRRKAELEMIDDLKKGDLPWQKPWVAGKRAFPYNPVTGTKYRGSNFITLANVTRDEGFNDDRWVTFNQIQRNGWKLRKGSRGSLVQYYSPAADNAARANGGDGSKDKDRTLLDDPDIAAAVDGDAVTPSETKAAEREKGQTPARAYPLIKYSYVYNAVCVEGMPITEKQREEFNARPNLEIYHEYAEKILRHAGIEIVHQNRDAAFYRPSEDKIYMPMKSQFKSVTGYYQCALHELIHATGAKSRLGRDQSGSKGSAKYAREELVAEIGSYILCSAIGIGTDSEEAQKARDNSASYIKRYMESLSGYDAVKTLRRAMAQASKATDFLTKGIEREIGLEIERVPEMDATRAENFMSAKKRFEPNLGRKITGTFLCVDRENDIALQGVYRHGGMAYLVEHKLHELSPQPDINDNATVLYEERGLGKLHVLTPHELEEMRENARNRNSQTREYAVGHRDYNRDRAKARAAAYAPPRSKVPVQTLSKPPRSYGSRSY